MPRTALTREKEGRSLSGMTDLAVVLALLAAAILMFAANRPRMDAVALLMLTLLPFTGVVSMGEALAGFADANVVLLATLFVIGDGLVRTGVAQRIGDRLMRGAGSSDTRLLVLLMLAVGVLGAVMSSTGVVAIFIPIALRIAQATGTPRQPADDADERRGAVSGMMTLVATAPNLVVNSELRRHGAAGFAFFSFTPFARVGAGAQHPLHALRPALALCRRWAATVGWCARACATGSTSMGSRAAAPAGPNPASPFVGRALEELDLRDTNGANVLGVERARARGAALIAPSPPAGWTRATSCWSTWAPARRCRAAAAAVGLEPMPLTDAYFADRAQDIGIVEVMVANDSPLIGRSVVSSESAASTD